jgi:hypothetical protein
MKSILKGERDRDSSQPRADRRKENPSDRVAKDSVSAHANAE